MLVQNWKQKFFLSGIFNKEEEDSYLNQNKVTKFYKSVYLMNSMHLAITSGKAAISSCLIMP